MITLTLTIEQDEIKNKLEVLFQNKKEEFKLNDWSFNWDKKISVYGTCSYATKTINMSLPLAVSNYEHAVDTMLHEFAHALTPYNGHGKEWKQKCIEIGAKPIRCGSRIELANNLIHLETKQKVYKVYRLNCTSCSFYTTRNRKSSSSTSCPKCSSVYDEKFKLIWGEPNISHRFYF